MASVTRTKTRRVAASNRRVRGSNVTMFASAARTSSPASSSTLDTSDASTLVLTLAATAKTGTSPTLDVKVQTSEDGTTWRDVPSATFTQLTSGTSLPSSETKAFNALSNFTKVVSTIGGSATPGWTYSVTGFVK